MNLRNQLIGVCMLLTASPLAAQLTIEMCYEKAHNNYPLIHQFDLIDKSETYNLSNANQGYLPQINFSAKAIYQSDVTKIPFDLNKVGISGIDIPTLSKDQYGATLEINQVLWDGGTIRSKKEGTKAAASVERDQTEVTLYTINQRVNQLFFGILLCQSQLKQVSLYQEDLNLNYERISSYVNNGIANATDLDAVRIDLLKSEQTKIQWQTTQKAYTAMLSLLIGEEVTESTQLLSPVAISVLAKENKRPELSLYESQMEQIRLKEREITASLMPKLGLFVTGGYGKPGLNMLENEFKPYYLAGVRLSWNIGSFYSQKNNRNLLRTQIGALQTQRETFLFNALLSTTQQENAIRKSLDQLKYDDEIIALRGAVKQAAAAKMAGGVISGTEFMREVTAELRARQDKILHEIELLQAIYDLKYTTNN